MDSVLGGRWYFSAPWTFSKSKSRLFHLRFYFHFLGFNCYTASLNFVINLQFYNEDTEGTIVFHYRLVNIVHFNEKTEYCISVLVLLSMFLRKL